MKEKAEPTEPLRVQLPVFEGPLDLLLYLVKRDEVNIYDIEIHRITEKYLECLAHMEEMNLEIAGDFMVMAANLIYIKSRTLLPVQEQAPDADAEEDDPRWDLIRQLIEYKKFKEASQDLQSCEARQTNIFHRRDLPLDAAPEYPAGLGKVNMLDLVQAFQKVLDRLEARRGFRELEGETFTVSQKIEWLLDALPKPGAARRFSQLFEGMASRNEIVATFLALLELIRLKQFRARQAELFEDIEIERTAEA